MERKEELFEKMNPMKALAIMALPTIASQLVVLIYNIADTWFIGRTNNPYMITASSLALTIYLAVVALANVFGVGGGSLMARLIGDKKFDEARKIVSYSILMSIVSSLVFSILVFIFMDAILEFLGASANTLLYGKQYVLVAIVLGSIPTALSMCMPQFLRNAGYSKEAGFGVGLGNILNIILDPIFMFVILKRGNEVLGAAVATLISNVISMLYFIFIYIKLKDLTVLELPTRIEKNSSENKKSLYSVGLPAAFSIFLFDIVTIVINKLTATYGDIPLAAMGVVLKLERIPINIGLGVCLGMVPLVAYNYGAKNYERMKEFSSLSRKVIIAFSVLCVIVFFVFAELIIASFIGDESTVKYGARFLRGRCFSLPFMLIGYHIVNYMNAIGKGKMSFILAIIRHLVLIIPIALIMNALWQLTGLVLSQVVADIINVVIASILITKNENIEKRMQTQSGQ